MSQLDVKSKSKFHDPNLGYALELSERYRQNPDLLDKGSRRFWRVVAAD
jgi:hypothetical protein